MVDRNIEVMRVLVKSGDLDDPQVIALLQTHVTKARAETALGSAHALDLSGLKSADIRFFAAWEAHKLAPWE